VKGTSRPLKGHDYLIRYVVDGAGCNIHEIIIRAIDARKAEQIFSNVYKGCRQTSTARRVS
jgi:hypothetical protein